MELQDPNHELDYDDDDDILVGCCTNCTAYLMFRELWVWWSTVNYDKRKENISLENLRHDIWTNTT